GHSGIVTPPPAPVHVQSSPASAPPLPVPPLPVPPLPALLFVCSPPLALHPREIPTPAVQRIRFRNTILGLRLSERWQLDPARRRMFRRSCGLGSVCQWVLRPWVCICRVDW